MGTPEGLQQANSSALINVVIPCNKVTLKFDFKEFKDVEIPVWMTAEDAVKQYVGIWKLFLSYVIGMQANTVLEFGTREGYSTRLFAEFLKFKGGQLVTVDLEPHKISADDIKLMTNVTFVKADILTFPHDYKENSVDILYIDDWHNSFHLYEELDRFARLAKVVMVHDVCQEWQISTGIMNGLMQWCNHNFMPYSIYPLNACGLAIIEVEKHRKFYEETSR